MPLDGQHVNSLASGTSTAHMKQSYSSLMIMPWPGRSGPLLEHQVHLDDVFFHVVNTGEGYLRATAHAADPSNSEEEVKEEAMHGWV